MKMPTSHSLHSAPFSGTFQFGVTSKLGGGLALTRLASLIASALLPAVLFERSSGQIVSVSSGFSGLCKGRRPPSHVEELRCCFAFVRTGGHELSGDDCLKNAQLLWCGDTTPVQYLGVRFNLPWPRNDALALLVFQACDGALTDRLAQGLGDHSARPSPPAGRSARLTSRELEVMELLRQGCSSKEISRRLNLSVNTVSAHRASMKRKLQARSSCEMVWMASGAEVCSEPQGNGAPGVGIKEDSATYLSELH